MDKIEIILKSSMFEKSTWHILTGVGLHESKMSDSDECMKYGGLRDKQI